MFKRFVATVVVLVLFAVCCGCSGKNADTASDTESTPAESQNANVSNKGEIPAVLNIKVKDGKTDVFKSNRPYDSKKEDITLILVTGQSNFTTSVGYAAELGAVNQGTAQTLSDAPVLPKKGIAYSFNTSATEFTLNDARDMSVLCNPSRGTSTLGGMSPSFAIKWNNLTNTKVVFVQAAVGAVGMHEWVPEPSKYTCTCSNNGQGRLYFDAVTAYKRAYNALSQKYNIVYTGYVWNQGEHEEVYGKPGNTVCDAKSYYDAYMEMHNGFVSQLNLDFGGISVVRADKAGSTAEGSNSYTIARAAQYKLCNDNDDLFMLSSLSETCSHAQMDQGNTIHYSQATFNKMGEQMAANLYKYLGFEKAEYTGIKVYSAYGSTACVFDKDGNLTEGSDEVTRSVLGNNLIARLNTLGTHQKIELSFTVDGVSAPGYIDDFGAIDWAEFSSTEKLNKFKINVIKE